MTSERQNTSKPQLDREKAVYITNVHMIFENYFRTGASLLLSCIRLIVPSNDLLRNWRNSSKRNELFDICFTLSNAISSTYNANRIRMLSSTPKEILCKARKWAMVQREIWEWSEIQVLNKLLVTMDFTRKFLLQSFSIQPRWAAINFGT